MIRTHRGPYAKPDLPRESLTADSVVSDSVFSATPGLTRRTCASSKGRSHPAPTGGA